MIGCYKSDYIRICDGVSCYANVSLAVMTQAVAIEVWITALEVQIKLYGSRISTKRGKCTNEWTTKVTLRQIQRICSISVHT